MLQEYNPLNYTTNCSTPDYEVCDQFRDFVGYGLMSCWLSGDPEDIGGEILELPRLLTGNDIRGIRDNFLLVLEAAIASLWKNPDAEIQHDWPIYLIGDIEVIWTASSHNQGIRMDLFVGNYGETIWLSFQAIEDQVNVRRVLAEARKVINAKLRL